MLKTSLHRLSGFLLLLFAGVLLTACNTTNVIVSNVDEKTANEIIVFLASNNLEATKTQAPSAPGAGSNVVLWNIMVPQSQMVDAMALLNKQGLPRTPGPDMLTVFAPAGLVPSEQEEQVRYQAALSEQLAGIIRKFEGVLDANVQLAFPPNNEELPAAQKIVRASIYIKHQGVMDDPNSHLATKVRRLVASSIPGLTYENVTLVAERASIVNAALTPYEELLPKEEKEYVRTWGVVVSKESVSSFRTLFFTFCTILFVALALLCWLIWKLLPVLEHLGGLRALLKLAPLRMSEASAPLTISPAPQAPEALTPSPTPPTAEMATHEGEEDLIEEEEPFEEEHLEDDEEHK